MFVHVHTYVYVHIGIGIELLFYLGKPLAMRLFDKAPRAVQTQAGEKKRKRTCIRNNGIVMQTYAVVYVRRSQNTCMQK